LIDSIFTIYDIIDNFKAIDIKNEEKENNNILNNNLNNNDNDNDKKNKVIYNKKFIEEEQIKTFKIYFLEFEKHFSISLEDYKNVFYNKLGYIFCDFQGNISKINIKIKK
jgi:hypothetical protein